MGMTAAALALVVAAHGSPPGEGPGAVVPLPDVLSTAPDRGDRMTLPVAIGDRGPWHFLIDTAAQKTVVSSGLVAALGLAPRGQGNVMGIAGNRVVPTVIVPDIRFGRVSYDSEEAPVLDAADLGADGIVGLDGLEDHRVTFDFAHDRIALTPSRSTERDGTYEIVVTARRRGAQLIMTNALIDGIRTDVVIDTGAQTSIGNRALQHALARRGKATRTTIHSVTGQEIPADYAEAGEMSIGSARISNLAIAFADAPTFTTLRLDAHPALLLGMRDLRLFRRFAIDFPTRKVMFGLPG